MKVNPKSEMLRRAMSDFWWTPDIVSVLDEDLATITHCPIDERIFNQVVPHAPIPQTKQFIERIAELHPGVSRWVCTEVCDHGLFSLLQRYGYKAEEEHGGFVVDVNSLGDTETDFSIWTVKNMTAMKRMYELRIDIFGGIFPSNEEQLAFELAHCTGEKPKVDRFVAEINGVLAGTGSITYFENLNFAFIWAGGVKEDFRGRGLYKALLSARAQSCRDRGIQYMGLYARDNTSAPIVASQGFEKVGTMVSYERTSAPK